MVTRSQLIKREGIEMGILAIYLVFIVLLSLFFLFGGGGIEKEDILAKNNFYIPYGVAFLIGIIAIKVVSLFVFTNKNEDIEGGLIHDPEQSGLGFLSLVKNPFLLLFFSIIVFSLLGWLFTSQQLFFNATPNYEQQFTTGADLYFSVYPASPTETLGAIFIISLYGLTLGIFSKKGKLSFVMFWVLFIIGSIILSGIFGYINHLARYGFDDVAIQNVVLFWSFGGLITAVSGSVIPFLVMHDINNFFFRISKLFSNDIVTFITFTIIGLLSLIFILVFIRVRSKKKTIQ